MQLNVFTVYFQDEFTGSARIRVSPGDSVEDLAGQIRDEVGLDDAPLIIFNGQRLEAAGTLDQAGIKADSLVTAWVL